MAGDVPGLAARNPELVRGPRRARPGEFLRGVRRYLFEEIGLRRRGSAGFCLRLDADPPIYYAGITAGTLTGIAPAARRARDAIVLLFTTITLEDDPVLVRRLREAAVAHRLFAPGHTIVFACNTEKEAERLTAEGEVAFAISHNILIPDGIFRPLPPLPLVYDAVYNARLAPFKRHELSLEIGSCAFIYYHAGTETAASDEAVRERHRALAPGHVFINSVRDGLPVWLNRIAINEVLNSSAVGLCLSAREGAMFASMEYLLAGLPVVNTPNLGGRDVYFDDDHCVTVDPDPRAIRDAVAALKARAIPRAHIAARTREKLERDRRRFLDLVDDVRERAGHARRNVAEWPWRDSFPLAWQDWADFLAGPQGPPWPPEESSGGA